MCRCITHRITGKIMARGRKAPSPYKLPQGSGYQVFNLEQLMYGNQALAKGHSLSGIAALNKRRAETGFSRGVNAADVSMNNAPHPRVDTPRAVRGRPKNPGSRPKKNTKGKRP